MSNMRIRIGAGQTLLKELDRIEDSLELGIKEFEQCLELRKRFGPEPSNSMYIDSPSRRRKLDTRIRFAKDVALGIYQRLEDLQGIINQLDNSPEESKKISKKDT